MNENKTALKRYADSYRTNSNNIVNGAVAAFYDTNATINVVHPFNELAGPENYISTFLEPLQHSFNQLSRSEYIAIGGEFSDDQWVACTGYYSGQFEKPWLGITPTGTLAHLRFAEFHKMSQGKAVESYIFLDIPALMIAAGVWPIKGSVGTHNGFRGYLPGPATQDGLIWRDSNTEDSASTLQLTETMLLNLATENESWRAYWHENMTWYGPAVFGAFQGIEEFAQFQTPFEKTFSEWIGGIMPGSVTKHFLRMADGNYSCLGGWPSLNMVQVKPFLGLPPSKQRVYMRVCDFWRRDANLLAENWVCVDALHFLLQLGYDVLENIQTPSR